MESVAAAQRPKRSWGLLALGLISFLFILPSFRLFVPIEQTSLLLVPVIAVCAVIGWLGGAKPLITLAWVILAAWLLLVPVASGGAAYDHMARGWALLLAGSFGLVSLWNSATPFFVRALGALGLAVGTGFLLAISSPGGVDRFQRVSASEFTRRSGEMMTDFHALTGTKEWKEREATSAWFADVSDFADRMFAEVPSRSAILLPALIALESLAALALGWALYHRLSPSAIGPRLSPLREFRFNDQLIWGIAVGATLLLMPPFQEGKVAGLNLLLFFGAIFFIRGMGVLAWMAHGRQLLLVTLIISVFIPPLIFLFAGAALSLGLGDTWLDWRGRARAGDVG